MAWTEAARKAAAEARRRKSQWRGLHTGDFQGRGGNYPRSDVPTYINIHKSGGTFAFKSTSQRNAEAWVNRYLNEKKLSIKRIASSQTGDYHDDWVDVHVQRGRFTGPRVGKSPVPKTPMVSTLTEASKRKARRLARKLRTKGI